MTNYKPINSKKEEFRKYLEKAGIMDVLTKVLVSLYEEPEKPDDAIDYLKNFVLQRSPNNAELESVKLELSELRGKYDQLQEQYQLLKQKTEAESLPTEGGEAIEESSEPEVAPDSVNPPAPVLNPPQ